MQHDTHTILTFRLNVLRFALYLHNVDRVIRAMAVASVPKAASSIYGIIDFHGEHIPVVNIRERFGMTQKDISESDRFIISIWKKRKLAVVVDEVERLIDITGQNINRIDVSAAHGLGEKVKNSGLELIDTMSDEEGIIIIYDLEKLLGSETIVAVEELFSLMDKEGLHG